MTVAHADAILARNALWGRGGVHERVAGRIFQSLLL
jgi:hypothetical protein